MKETMVIGMGMDGGKNNYRYREGHTHNSSKKGNTPYHQKWNHIETKQEKGKDLQNKPSKNYEDKCYKYGMKGHWSYIYYTPKQLVDMYQDFVKDKRKGIEKNFVDHNELMDPLACLDTPNGMDNTYLDVFLFL